MSNENKKDYFDFYRKMDNDVNNINKKEEEELLQENISNDINDVRDNELKKMNMYREKSPSTIKLEKKREKIFNRMKKIQNLKTEKERSDFYKEEKEEKRKKHPPGIEVVYQGELDYFVNTSKGLIPMYKNIQWNK